MGLGSDQGARAAGVLRLPQQPHEVALVLEHRARVMARPERRRRRPGALNFSEWNKPMDSSAGDVADAIRSGSMPPWFYVLLHSSAKLSSAEKDALVRGLDATFAASPPKGGGG